MASRILAVQVEARRLEPAEADLRISVEVSDGGEIRGRWVGPRCALRSTVDVAYPLRPAEPGRQRVIIPEPAMWEPASPFLYDGIVELWQGEQRLDRVSLDHGLRSVALGPKGLRWNQEFLALRGVVRQELNDAEALHLRARGINLILTDTSDGSVEQAADRLGFVVIRRILGGEHLPGPDTPVSLLGLLLRGDLAAPRHTTMLLGMPGDELAPGCQFRVADEGSRLVLRGPGGVEFAQIETN
jgi:hypothetical protein